MRNTPERQQQFGEFFTANADRLERAVARKMYARQELIADACADAWTILLRRPDITLDQKGSAVCSRLSIGSEQTFSSGADGP